jgi:hypothetical protein
MGLIGSRAQSRPGEVGGEERSHVRAEDPGNLTFRLAAVLWSGSRHE